MGRLVDIRREAGRQSLVEVYVKASLATTTTVHRLPLDQSSRFLHLRGPEKRGISLSRGSDPGPTRTDNLQES